jgi:hypothetical protein
MTDEHNESDKDIDDQQKMSNAKVALFITMIPVMLFIASFFIQRG